MLTLLDHRTGVGSVLWGYEHYRAPWAINVLNFQTLAILVFITLSPDGHVPLPLPLAIWRVLLVFESMLTLPPSFLAIGPLIALSHPARGDQVATEEELEAHQVTTAREGEVAIPSNIPPSSCQQLQLPREVPLPRVLYRGRHYYYLLRRQPATAARCDCPSRLYLRNSIATPGQHTPAWRAGTLP